MKDRPNKRYVPIADYGVIGNLHTVALVSLHASIDFMCFTRFDAPTIFCRLLDADKGGAFSIQPFMEDVISKQFYLPDTNVLVTRFLADEGIAEVIDYMPVGRDEHDCAIIRKITTIKGDVNYLISCCPRFNYAREKHVLQRVDHNSFVFTPETGVQQPVRLLASVPLSANGHDVVSELRLKEGESACFALESLTGHQDRKGTLSEYVEETYRTTITYWQNWISKSNYEGQWQDVVKRSALVLKLLTSQRYGSTVAAPTFSLPEAVGESRNWDYRFTWIRDAAFTMHAFLQLGFKEEGAAFLTWVRKQSSENDLQSMFGIDGKAELDETVLDHLEGYLASKPVRIGNDAYKQTQLDIYGELLEAIYIFTQHDGDIDFDYWKIVERYVEVVIRNWRKGDHSIWEVRGEKRRFLFSAVMNWIALDRAIKIGDKYSFPYDMLKWRNTRNDIFREVHQNFWNQEKQAFVQFEGSDHIDASALVMPIFNMVSPFLERWQKTLVAIDRELRSGVLIHRYVERSREIDGLGGPEGTFSMCSFWYAECLALAGEMEKGREHFEKMLGYSNHLGLFSEQIGNKGEFLGNFPQAFTHLALISAAIELNKKPKTFSKTPPAFVRKTK